MTMYRLDKLIVLKGKEKSFNKKLPHFLSLGAGVQSSTLALMAARGEISPMPDAAVFADTQNEPPLVYNWLDWLEQQLPFPVFRVSKGNLAINALRLIRSKKSKKLYSKGGIPTYIKKPDGTSGILLRQCTADYKITVIQNKIKDLLNLKRIPKASSVLCIQWIGISLDESLRMKDSRLAWIENRWPLIELRMTRDDCLKWMEDKGYPKPPRSACVFCPYHSDAEWLRLKKEEPEAFKFAANWEKQYQRTTAKDEVTMGVPFLHKSLIQIDKVQFRDEGKRNFINECEGMCGV